jgi:hypothetical protein
VSADMQRAAAILGPLLEVGKSAMRSAGAHSDAIVDVDACQRARWC